MSNYFINLNSLKVVKRWTSNFLSGQGYCILCGHDYPLDLEDDHVGGRKNSDWIVSLCRNCHGRKSTIQRRSWPEEWFNENNPPAIKNAFVIRGFSDLLRLKSDQMFWVEYHE